MRFHVLACDYDRTLALDGRIVPETLAAIGRARATGRRVLLVTGRNFEDLLAVCPEIDAFDLVVAENGAVLYDPAAPRVEDLATAPPPALLAALDRAGVPYAAGRVIVASVVPYEVTILETIRRLGLELHIIFNKESVMILPSGVTKATGFREALRRLGISRHNAVAIGDAENDHAFLAAAGFGVAVANAVPALAESADHVTAAPNGAGVREFVDGPLARDLEDFRVQLLARAVTLGTRDDGTPFAVPATGATVVMAGDDRGTVRLAGVFVEQLVAADYVVCLLLPRGDPKRLGAREGVVVLGSEASGDVPARGPEVERLLRHRSTSVALDLGALPAQERTRAACRLLEGVQRLRAETGAPHWVVIDRADELFAGDGNGAAAPADLDWSGVCLVTARPEALHAEVRARAGYVLATSLEAVAAHWPLLDAVARAVPVLPRGAALALRIAGGTVATVERFMLTERAPRVAVAAAR